MRRARAATALLALATLAEACAPTVRAGDYYAAPLWRTAAPTSPIEARWRVLPPPSGCGTPGAPIVFVPALGLTQHSWAGVATALGACRARVLLDLPGIGEAPRTGAFDDEAALRALFDVVDAVAPGGRVVLAGHSLGGAIVARAAARLGARVEGMVLVAAPVAPFPLNLWERVLLFPSLWPPLFHLGGAFEGARLGIRRVSGGGDRPSDVDLALVAREWSDHQRRGAVLEYYRAFLEATHVQQSEAALAEVRAPTLLLWGADDHIVPVGVMTEARAHLVQAAAVTTRVVPGVGHLVPQAAARTVTQAIDAFVATLPATPNVAAMRALPAEGLRPGDVVWSAARELFPLVGVGMLAPLDGRVDLSVMAGLARGGVDPRYPIESGRLALLVGAAVRGESAGWSFAYLRATGRFELVWRWGGGYHIDGTLLVDPRNGRVGGLGALGYTPSVVPWLRGFAAFGALPGEGARAFLGLEVDARLTGWRY